MKQKTILNLIVIVVFVGITVSLADNHAESDGWDLFGFPFNFYKYTGGKLADRSEYAKLGFYPKYFILDLLILFITIFVVNYIAAKLKLIKSK